MRPYIMPLVVALAILFLASVSAPTAQAGPPSYLLLRQPESPSPQGHPGYPGSRMYDVRTYDYAYGYFGAVPRSHWSRHFGTNRMYSQWSKW